MSNILSYEFSELPLVLAPGIEAGLTNGLAEIKYDRNGHWDVDSVSIEGYQALTPEQIARGVKRWVYVAAPDGIAELITRRLEQEWFDKVQDAVNDELASAREDAREARAEARRDDRMMGL